MMETWRAYLTKISTGKVKRESRKPICECVIINNEIVDSMLEIKVSLTAAQIKTLSSVPVQCIAAPGVGKFIEVISASYKYIFNSVAFANTQLFLFTDTVLDGRLNYQKRSAPLSNPLSSSSNQFQTMVVDINDVDSNSNIIENKALMVRSENDSVVGNSTVNLYIAYRIVTV